MNNVLKEDPEGWSNIDKHTEEESEIKLERKLNQIYSCRIGIKAILGILGFVEDGTIPYKNLQDVEEYINNHSHMCRFCHGNPKKLKNCRCRNVFYNISHLFSNDKYLNAYDIRLTGDSGRNGGSGDFSNLMGINKLLDYKYSGLEYPKHKKYEYDEIYKLTCCFAEFLNSDFIKNLIFFPKSKFKNKSTNHIKRLDTFRTYITIFAMIHSKKNLSLNYSNCENYLCCRSFFDIMITLSQKITTVENTDKKLTLINCDILIISDIDDQISKSQMNTEFVLRELDNLISTRGGSKKTIFLFDSDTKIIDKNTLGNYFFKNIWNRSQNPDSSSKLYH